MSVFRVNKNSNYTVISNYHLRDMNLSLKAKGLLSFMLSLPDNWNYSEMGLVSCLKENRSAIRSALKELEECGYLVRYQVRKEGGKFSEIVYDVHEKPLSENRTSENRTQINTDLTNRLTEINKEKNPLYPPRGERVAEHPPQKKQTRTKKENPQQEADFERFWKAYPRKQAKSTAKKAFLRLNASPDLLSQMLKALEEHKLSRQWTKDGGTFIPYASTWLNQRRWEDELATENHTPSQSPKKNPNIVNGIDWSRFDGKPTGAEAVEEIDWSKYDG